MSLKTDRRAFLLAGSSLVLTFAWPKRSFGGPAAEVAERRRSELNAYLLISPDDTITILVPESEMGQGVLTSLPMLIAEELEVDWAKVRSEHALADPSKYGRQLTGGSSSVTNAYTSLREAGAAAREMLIAAAAKSWKVGVSECRAEKGQVLHSSGKKLGYGELAPLAARETPPKKPALKTPDRFALIGKPRPRIDAQEKVTGRAIFGIDVKVPGLLTALIARCPVFGGKLARFDGANAKKVPGVRQVIKVPSGVAVVADHFWAAKTGRDALEIEWDEGGNGDLSSQSIRALLVSILPKGVEVEKRGDPGQVIGQSRTKLEADYEVPYLAHATMEPLNATAFVSSDRCEIWAPTQAASSGLEAAMKITGLPRERITLHTTFLGGGFGRKAQSDFVAEAVHLSKVVRKPVKVVWTREDDMRGGYYRPVAYNRLWGALDASGWPMAWVHQIASPSILSAFGPLKGGIDSTSVEGASNLPYDIPSFSVTYAKADLPISVWFWRSVGSSINAYATECFLDELARLGGKDPLEVRRRLLANKPRHKAVLEEAARRAGWGKPLPKGVARGIAVHESFGSYVAQVAEVRQEDGRVRVLRVVCAVDSGQVVNPSTVVAQMESGIVYGLSAALYGQVPIANGRAAVQNFSDYPVLRIGEMPTIETYLVPSGDAHGGIGEPGTPPIAPAVANALLALTGKPVRRLPIAPS